MSRSMAAAPTERSGAMPVFVLELQGIRIPGTWVSKRVWIANKGRRCTPAAHHYMHYAYAGVPGKIRHLMGHLTDGRGFRAL
jgi:hypothetical protein